jgi:hypothetical protein
VPSDEGVDGVVRGENPVDQPAAGQPQRRAAARRASRHGHVKLKFEDVKAGKTLWENPSLSL